MDWDCGVQEAIRDAIAEFPAEFGLRAFPGERFRISEAACFVSEGRVVLYTYVLRDGNWLAFAKGSPAELRREITA